MECLGNPSIPEPYMVQVPMVLSKPGTAQVQQSYVAYPIMMPHEPLAYVYKEHSSTFNKIYMGTDGSAGDARSALEECWTSVETAGDLRLDHHPMKQSPHWTTTYIPMALHGDAKVSKAGTKSFDATNISPLMAIGQTNVTKQFVFGLLEQMQGVTKPGQCQQPANHP